MISPPSSPQYPGWENIIALPLFIEDDLLYPSTNDNEEPAHSLLLPDDCPPSQDPTSDQSAHSKRQCTPTNQRLSQAAISSLNQLQFSSTIEPSPPLTAPLKTNYQGDLDHLDFFSIDVPTRNTKKRERSEDEKITINTVLIDDMQTITESNVISIITRQFFSRSTNILNQCLVFLQEHTHTTFLYNSSHSITIVLHYHNTAADFARLSRFLPDLKALYGENNLRIVIQAGPFISISALKNFILSNRSFIQEFSLPEYSINDSNIVTYFWLGLEFKSIRLLNQCSHYLLGKKNITTTYNESEQPVLHISLRTPNAAIIYLSALLTHLEERSNGVRIHLEFDNKSSKNNEILQEFVNRHGPLIEKLHLHTIAPTQLLHVLKQTPNLCHLQVQSKKIIRGNGMVGKAIQSVPKLQTLSFAGCSQMTSPPPLSNLPQLTEVCFDDCRLAETNCINEIHNLIKSNPERIFRLNLIRKFLIKDTSSIEGQLADKDIDLYLANHSQLNLQNGEACQNVLLKLVNHGRQDILSHYASILSGTIANTDLLRELLLQVDDVKDVMQTHDLSPEHNDFVSLYIFIKSVENNDLRTLEHYFSGNEIKEIELYNFKDLPWVKAFFQKNASRIIEREKLLALTKKLYPPNEEGNSQYYYWQIQLRDLEISITSSLHAPTEQAPAMLRQLAYVIRFNPFLRDIYVKFIENEGIDAGGLTKEFFSSLVRGLIASKTADLCFWNISDRENFKLPIARNALTEIVSPQQEDSYRNLGTLLAFLWRNEKNYPIGEIFHESFFKLLLSFSKEDLEISPALFQTKFVSGEIQDIFNRCRPMIDREHLKKAITTRRILQSADTFDDLSSEQIIFVNSMLPLDATINASNYREKKEEHLNSGESLNALHMAIAYKLRAKSNSISSLLFVSKKFTDFSPQLKGEFKQVCASLDIPVGEVEDINDTNFDFESAKNELIKLALENRICVIIACQMIAKGIKGYLGESYWENFKSKSAKSIRRKIQGTLSKASMKRAIKITGQDNTIKSWIEKWIDDESTTIEKMRAVLRSITGSTALVGHGGIKINIISSSGSIMPHACFNSLDVPSSITEEWLLHWLNTCSDKAEVFNRS